MPVNHLIAAGLLPVLLERSTAPSSIGTSTISISTERTAEEASSCWIGKVIV
jgi:hypothetical protein